MLLLLLQVARKSEASLKRMREKMSIPLLDDAGYQDKRGVTVPKETTTTTTTTAAAGAATDAAAAGGAATATGGAGTSA